MRGRAISLSLVALAMMASPVTARGLVLAGGDEASLLPPSGASVANYSNAGYELSYGEGGIAIRVDLSPLGSTAPFSAPRAVGQSPLQQTAYVIVRGSSTVYDAVSEVLAWVRGEIEYELDRSLPQDADSVLRRRTAYCAGTAKLAVALLAEVGIEAREVPGYVYAAAPGTQSVQPGFHRWIEVRYPDRGWAFSDPLASHHFVPATYLRLAAEMLEDSPAPGRLLNRHSAMTEIDIAPKSPNGIRVRPNDSSRASAALVLRFDGGRRAEATLTGEGVRRRRTIVGGEVRFLGLPNGSYELRVHRDGHLAAWKSLTFRAPILAELEIPANPAPPAAGGGGP